MASQEAAAEEKKQDAQYHETWIVDVHTYV